MFEELVEMTTTTTMMINLWLLWLRRQFGGNDEHRYLDFGYLAYNVKTNNSERKQPTRPMPVQNK